MEGEESLFREGTAAVTEESDNRRFLIRGGKLELWRGGGFGSGGGDWGDGEGGGEDPG